MSGSESVLFQGGVGCKIMTDSNVYAMAAGCCASIASFMGKLSGNSDINIYVSIICIAVMLLMNAVMWTLYSKALALSKNSIRPTLISSTSNFMLSGILGIVIFKESTSLLWWSGIGFILFGLFFITRRNLDSEVNNEKSD